MSEPAVPKVPPVETRADGTQVVHVPRPPPAPAAQPPAPTTPRVELTIELASRTLVRFLWIVSQAIAWLVGAELSELSEVELVAGASEAVAIITRFRWLRWVLAFLGLPGWFVRMVMAKAKWRPQSKRAAAQPASAPVPPVRLVPPRPPTADEIATAATRGAGWSEGSPPGSGS